MRIRILSVLLLAVAAATTFSLTRGQDSVTPRSKGETVSPQKARQPAPSAPPASVAKTPAHDFSKLNILQNEMLRSCQRGADWLFRVNGVNGRFLPGYLPALGRKMESDHYLRQAGAAFALARTARFLGEERYAARATQAILTLLDDTTTDADAPQCRHTTLPSTIVNRLGAAALLVLAINELPAPQKDLLEKSEQLCNWIKQQARANGSLCCGDDAKAETDDVESVNAYPGLALYAVLRSHKNRPAAWKPELTRKAAAYYRPWWKAHRGMAFVPAQTAACAEAYLLTKEATFAEFAYEMNDWLCGLQYDHIDPRRLSWYGGFMDWGGDKVVDAPPGIASASYAASLAEACRVARAGSDPAHHQRYSEVLERGLQFVVRLQYTDASAQHFAEWYRPRLVGAFHASVQDGNLRIDYTQHALSALVAYLEETSP